MTDTVTLPTVDFKETERLQRLRSLRDKQSELAEIIDAVDDRYFELVPLETRAEMEERILSDNSAWSKM
jgi:restriction endonuclease Mrr